MCTERAKIRTKGSLRVKVEKKEEDAHSCQSKKNYTKEKEKRTSKRARNTQKNSLNIFWLFLSQLTKSRTYIAQNLIDFVLFFIWIVYRGGHQ
jgi:hypothetical protein